MVWILLGVAFEILWALGLKYTTQNIWEIIGIALCVLSSSLCLIQACKKMEVSIVYTIFVGLGAGLLTCIDMWINNFSLKKLVLIITLLCGVMGLKLLSRDAK
ncbi:MULTISPECIES: DMT family transporter [unclassified Helicobacter]|uniref:DMT family transporter n=1 Tax=unclassified Helicobacter TaxID=2593540 RepID=UPI000CF0DFED|nr:MULTISPECIES: SMR family transporter [unclassified Helicobacter]